GRSLSQASESLTQKALLPFVTGLGAYPILLAQRSKIQRPHRLHRKLNSLLHRFTLFPRHGGHSLSLLASKSVTYVLNLQCYLCSEPGPVLASRQDRLRKDGRGAKASPTPLTLRVHAGLQDHGTAQRTPDVILS